MMKKDKLRERISSQKGRLGNQGWHLNYSQFMGDDSYSDNFISETPSVKLNKPIHLHLQLEIPEVVDKPNHSKYGNNKIIYLRKKQPKVQSNTIMLKDASIQYIPCLPYAKIMQNSRDVNKYKCQTQHLERRKGEQREHFKNISFDRMCDVLFKTRSIKLDSKPLKQKIIVQKEASVVFKRNYTGKKRVFGDMRGSKGDGNRKHSLSLMNKRNICISPWQFTDQEFIF